MFPSCLKSRQSRPKIFQESFPLKSILSPLEKKKQRLLSKNLLDSLHYRVWGEKMIMKMDNIDNADAGADDDGDNENG